MVIFDCNGVLVDSEPIASAVFADALSRIGLPLTADTVARSFHGRRPADIFAAAERITKRALPSDFAAGVAAETSRRLRAELRAVPHAAHALTWIRGPKAVASSSAMDRIRLSLNITDLLRFFEPRLFSASEVPNGKPAPDLFMLAAARMRVAPADCFVVEDSVAGVVAAKAAGMRPIGFVGRSHDEGELARDLRGAGARAVIADLRALKSTISDLRGW
ncbi:MAG: HAD-IA family hydrolase [Xanthobacteraceae bacterium]|nr:HAD-IA family hydrolase [Xanthobacteraceae bacterium]